jgi:hypothetical protein
MLSTRCWNIAAGTWFHSSTRALVGSGTDFGLARSRRSNSSKKCRWSWGQVFVQASQVLPYRLRKTWALSCWNSKELSPNGFHKVGSTELSRMSLYPVTLRFPFSGTKGPSPDCYSSSTKHYSWNYALGQAAFSWHPTNPLQSTLGIVHGDLRLVCGCTPMETHFMKLLTNSYCASRSNLELGSGCCNRWQMIFTH